METGSALKTTPEQTIVSERPTPYTPVDLEKLKDPIPYKWRVQSFSKFKPSASCVAYIDARDVMNVFDSVVGPDSWQDDYKVVGDNLMAGIGVKCDGEWVWKWDTGTESQVEKEKGHVSDAFKRAAIHWGPGRFLYNLPIKYIKANEKKTGNNFPFPVDDNGNRIYDVTAYLNGQHGKQEPPPAAKITPDQVITIRDLIVEVGANVDAFLKWCNLKLIEDIPADKFDYVVAKLNEKKEPTNASK